MNNELRKLLCLSQAELDKLFTESPAGAVPHGRYEGIFLIAPGTILSAPAAVLIRVLWQGKVFDALCGRVNNLILPFSFEAVEAILYKAASRFDGRECIVLEYSSTSLVAHWVRDEIREVRPAMYLGKSYFGIVPMPDFALVWIHAAK